MVGEESRPALHVNAGDVADVVAVGFKPAHHWVLPIPQIVRSAIATAFVFFIEWPVVTDGVRSSAGILPKCAAAATGVAVVETVAAIVVICFPGGVIRLECNIREARVVAYDERDVAKVPSGDIGQERVVDTRNPGARHRPGGGDGPVPAVGQPGRAVGQAGWLTLRQGC